MDRSEFWWGMVCWNGLSPSQQRELVERGTLEFGYKPRGRCKTGAEVAIETVADASPGPRFYCLPCAVAYINDLDGR